MIKLIDQAQKNGDTLGGIFEVVARNVPSGLGSYSSWSEKLDGRIAQAMMSIHAVKAVELGTGVANAAKKGSEVHDEIVHDAEKGFHRLTNRAGGLEGGITNGEEIRVRPLHETLIDAADTTSLDRHRYQARGPGCF